ncbi:MAG: hypothetical protein AABZ31_01025, partial [Bdellovibrionota bacterium]
CFGPFSYHCVCDRILPCCKSLAVRTAIGVFADLRVDWALAPHVYHDRTGQLEKSKKNRTPKKEIL